MPRPTLRTITWTAWGLTLLVSIVHYAREHALEHFLWHLAYGGAAGLLVAAGWTLYRNQPTRAPALWALGGYLFMIVPDLIWLAPTLTGHAAREHEVWMDIFLGHVFLDTWRWTRAVLVPAVVVALGAYVGAVRKVTTTSPSE